MTELNFKCKNCRIYFNCDVGQISFPLDEERPRFEKNIICPRCGIISMDDVELTEVGQSQLTEVYMSSYKTDALEMLNAGELINGFVESGLMVDCEIIKLIVKRDDEEIYDALFEIVKEDKYWWGGEIGAGWSPIHTLFILGLKGGEKSFEILKYMVTHRTEELGDWTTESLSPVFYSFGLKYFDKIKDIALDDSLDKYVRLAAIDALCAFAVLNSEFMEKTAELCKQFLREEEYGDTIALALPPMAEIKDEELFELVRKSHEKYDIGPMRVCDVEDLEEIHEGRSWRTEYSRCTEDLWKHFSDENLNYLFKITYGKPKVKEDKPKINKKKKIGRNEPCPCGSGKKYKKCCGNCICLAAQT